METRFWFSRVLFSAAAVFLGTACPALNQADVDDEESTGDSGGTATTLPTTAGMTMTTADTGGGSGDATSTDGGTTLNVSGTDGTTTDVVPEPTETTAGEATNGETDSSTTSDPVTSSSDGDPTTGGCSPSGDGQWADCAHGGSCDAKAGSCITIGSQGDGCMFSGCSDVCDCPPVPGTGNPTLTCADVAGPGGPDGVPDCYLSCEEGETCPDGMECLQDSYCAFPTVVVGYYEGCDTQGYGCPADATCIDFMGGVSTCLPQNCDGAGECPDVPGGNEACNNIIGMGGGPDECYLSCNNDGDCPATWECEQNVLCVQNDP